MYSSKADLVTGVDIGGSHITAGMIDMQSRTLLSQSCVRKKVDCKASAESILETWSQAIIELWSDTRTKAPVGFAMPGPFDYENGICLIQGLDKYESLFGMNIREELAERLSLPGEAICFRNDAEAFLEGELFCGAAKGYTDAIGITLGTGLGSALSHQGACKDAELSVTPYQGEIIEEFVSTRGLLRRYFQLTGTWLKDAKAVAELHDTDKAAKESFEHFASDLAWFLHQFIQKESPQALVIGGNIMHSWDLFMPQVIRSLCRTLSHLPRIVKAQLGESGMLIGGACCFHKEVFPEMSPEADYSTVSTINS